MEDIGQVTNVELVVEVLGSLTISTHDCTVQLQRCLDDDWDLLVDRGFEFAEVLSEVGTVDLR